MPVIVMVRSQSASSQPCQKRPLGTIMAIVVEDEGVEVENYIAWGAALHKER
jgi:hypothetical protein